MLLKEMIKENYSYQNKQPILLKELKEFINSKFKKNFSSAAIRNILLDNPSENLGYFPSYVRGIYLPFPAQREEEIVRRYSGVETIYPIGRLLAAKLGLSNQAYLNGTYIVFTARPLAIHNRDKLITKNDYYFIIGATKDIKDKILKLFELMIKVKFDVFIKYNDEIEELMKWYENDYQNVLKVIKVVGLPSNDKNLSRPMFDSFKEYTGHISQVGSIIHSVPLPRPFDFNFIGVMKVLKDLGGKNE